MSWLSRMGWAPAPSRIAPVGPDASDAMAAIHASAFARPWDGADFDALLSDPAVRIDGLFVGRSPRPSGFCVSRVTLDEAEILSLALARAVRGEGRSRSLLSQHLGELRHLGVLRVHLEVEEGNLPALALYRRAGFVQSGLRPGYYLRPDGSRASAMSMTRHLGPDGSGP